ALGRREGRMVCGDERDPWGMRSRRAGACAVPFHRQDRRAQRTHGLRARRDAIPAARLSRRRVVTRTERAWRVLGDVLDPEVPALSVRDLGIVRDVIDHGDEIEVVLTPTYSGCPATEVIEQSVRFAIEAEGLGPVRATLRRAPAWTTDWISEEGRRKLNDYGIAPPGPAMPDAAVPI